MAKPLDQPQLIVSSNNAANSYVVEEEELEEEEDSLTLLGLGTAAVSLAMAKMYDSVNIQFKLQHPKRDVLESNSTLRYTGLFQGMRRIMNEEGIRGFFKGSTASMIGSLSKNLTESLIVDRLPINAAESYFLVEDYDTPVVLPARERFWDTFVHRSVCSTAELASYPFQTIAIRQQSQHPIPELDIDTPGIAEATSQILNEGGITSLYSGFHVAVLSKLVSSVTFLAVQEVMLRVSGEKDTIQQHQSDTQYYEISLVYELIPKIIASIVSTPIDLVRIRLQQNDKQTYNNGAIDAVQQIYKTEGIRGFYKGTFYYLILSLFGRSHK